MEAAAMIVSFLLLGRWLEAKSRRSAGDALRELLELGAESAFVVRKSDGTDVGAEIPASELRVGDVFRVHPGETIATDGRVLEGESAVDAALVTGESIPVDVGPGSEVVGATINANGSLLVVATRVGEETTLAQMGRLLTEAQTGKAPVQRLADRISAVFVPAVIGIALVTFLIRIFLFSHSLEMALTSAITVLVVACPCALGLATPTALLVGSGQLSRRGVLISGPEVLENAHSVDAMILDKTGTLTTGEMNLSQVWSTAAGSSNDSAGGNAVLALAAGLESHSTHPIAQAIIRGADEAGVVGTEVKSFMNIPGKGVSGVVAGEVVRTGTLAWIREEGVDTTNVETAFLKAEAEGATAVVVGKGDMAIGIIAVTDTIRSDAKDAIAEIISRGITPYLVTGDNPVVAAAVAGQLGITQIRAGVLPEGKVDVVAELQAEGKKVAMVGDGVNDAAALAAADLSIAMGSGTDVAKAAAGMTIVNSHVASVATALRISAATLRIIKENLLWAFGYNIIAIPLAIFGIIVPGIAAAAMASSSVIVVMNSLRLRRAE